MLAIAGGTGHIYPGMQLVWLSDLILSVVMLRSKDFSKATAWVGILGFGLSMVGIMNGSHYTSTGEYTTVQGIIIDMQYVGGGLL